MVGVGESGCNRVAHNFGGIELKIAIIGASDKDAAHGIHRAVPNAAAAELEIAGVLMQERREHRGGHQCADSRVGVERAIALCVSAEALPIRRIAVPCLAHQGDHSDERNGDGIGHRFRGEFELYLCVEGLELVPVFDGQVVRPTEKEAIILWRDPRWNRRRGRRNPGADLRASLRLPRRHRRRRRSRRRLFLSMNWNRTQKQGRSGGPEKFSRGG